jgi:hypothetical protein
MSCFSPPPLPPLPHPMIVMTSAKRTKFKIWLRMIFPFVQDLFPADQQLKTRVAFFHKLVAFPGSKTTRRGCRGSLSWPV